MTVTLAAFGSPILLFNHSNYNNCYTNNIIHVILPLVLRAQAFGAFLVDLLYKDGQISYCLALEYLLLNLHII